MATNFGTTLSVNGLGREITTWGFHKDGLFSVTPYVCWLLCLGFVVAVVGTAPLLQAGDCQAGN